MTLVNTIRTAFHGLTGNKLRAALTALGVIIGVASVIATLALGNGARASVESNFRFLGSDEISINAELRFEENEGSTTLAGAKLSYEDGLLMPDAVDLVDRVEMTVRGSGKLRHGRIVSRHPRAWMGFYSQPTEEGIVVAGVVPRGPADCSGVEEGDVIVAVDEEHVGDRRTLYQALWKHQAGERVRLTVMRNDNLKTLAVVSQDRAEFYY